MNKVLSRHRINKSLLCAFTIGAFSLSTAQAQDLLAHFPLDGGPSPGEIYGEGAPQSVAGVKGGAMLFSGDSVIAYPVDISDHRQLTFTAWIKITDPENRKGLIAATGRAPGPSIGLYGNNGIFRLRAGRKAMGTYDNLPLNEWVFVAGAVDFDAGEARTRAGEFAATFTDFETEPDRIAPQTYEDPNDSEAEKQHYVFVGARDFTLRNSAISIAIDDVRIYGSALGEDQLASLSEENADGGQTIATGNAETPENSTPQSADELAGEPEYTVAETENDAGRRSPGDGISDIPVEPPGSDLEQARQGDGGAAEEESAGDIGRLEDPVLADGSGAATDPAITGGSVKELPAQEEIEEDATEVASEESAADGEAREEEHRREELLAWAEEERARQEEEQRQAEEEAAMEKESSGEDLSSASSQGSSSDDGSSSPGDDGPVLTGWRVSETDVMRTPVSGINGQEMRPIELANGDTVGGMMLGESNDIPCVLRVNGVEGAVNGRDECGGDGAFALFGNALEVSIDGASATQLQVCTNTKNNRRVKGFKLGGYVIQNDGSRGSYRQGADERTNCNAWVGTAKCDNDFVATGLVAHFNLRTGALVINDKELVGLQLVCRRVIPVFESQ